MAGLPLEERIMMYYVQCFCEKRLYTVDCASLKEALDIADVFICQGFSPKIIKG